MEFFIKARCKTTFTHQHGEEKATHVSTDFNLETSDGIPREQCFDLEGLPTKDGCAFLTQAFIQGLIGNLHYAHHKEFRDSAEHLRYIISELERAFIEVPTISKAKF